MVQCRVEEQKARALAALRCVCGRGTTLNTGAAALGDHPCTWMSAFRQQRQVLWSTENATCRTVRNASCYPDNKCAWED